MECQRFPSSQKQIAQYHIPLSLSENIFEMCYSMEFQRFPSLQITIAQYHIPLLLSENVLLFL